MSPADLESPVFRSQKAIEMKIIVGLGNPGKQYEGTRHNAGFVLLDRLACEGVLAPVGECISFRKEEKFEAMIGETLHKGEKIVLVKPQTFMNLSGNAVTKIMDYYKAPIEDLAVISDDLDLPIGMARIRQIGSSGGQRGLQNIIDMLKTDQFLRIRLGIRSIGGDVDRTEAPESKIDAMTFVLGKFDKRELPVFNDLVDEVIKYFVPHIGSKDDIPAHTIEIKVDSL